MLDTSLVYIVRDGECLMLYRDKKENDINEGKWIGIGGKREGAESPEECALREVREETGLRLTDLTYRGLIHFSQDDFAEDMYLYTASAWNGELLKECDEGELRWIETEKLAELNLWEGDHIFLRELTAGTKNFVMRLHYNGEELEEAWVRRAGDTEETKLMENFAYTEAGKTEQERPLGFSLGAERKRE